MATNLSANEIIEIVNENNQVLTPQPRYIMRRDKLIHRATYGFIKTSTNYFYVQKRSSLKDYCPSFYDPAPGGVVAAGESYEETNRREIEEEMGIQVSETRPSNHLATFYFENERLKCFGDIWEMTYDGPLRIQIEEVESVEMMTMEEMIRGFENGEKFTPDGIYACREYVKLKGLPVPIGPKPEVTLY